MSAEIRWVDECGNAHCRPTVTDALEYVNNVLEANPEEFEVMCDGRCDNFKYVAEFINKLQQSGRIK